jgi:hypothetical protein
MSEKLTELRSQVETKQREADAILNKSDYAPGDLEKAEKLTSEIGDICRLIDGGRAHLRHGINLGQTQPLHRLLFVPRQRVLEVGFGLRLEPRGFLARVVDNGFSLGHGGVVFLFVTRQNLLKR